MPSLPDESRNALASTVLDRYQLFDVVVVDDCTRNHLKAQAAYATAQHVQVCGQKLAFESRVTASCSKGTIQRPELGATGASTKEC